MKKIFCTLLAVALMTTIAFCAVGCTKDISGALTNEVAQNLLFGQNQAFALMDQAVNYTVEYVASQDDSKTAGMATLVLDETNGVNFVSLYANSSYIDGEDKGNSIAYAFLNWEEKKNGSLEKSQVMLSSYTDGVDDLAPVWNEYSDMEMSGSVGAPVKMQYNTLISNCGAHHGTRYIREEIYNNNKDVFDTVQITGTGHYNDKEMQDMFKAEVVITYNYVDDNEVTVHGKVTVVLDKREIKLVDGRTVDMLTITSINIAEEGGFNLTANYTYGVNSFEKPTEDNLEEMWPEEYPIA